MIGTLVRIHEINGDARRSKRKIWKYRATSSKAEVQISV